MQLAGACYAHSSILSALISLACTQSHCLLNEQFQSLGVCSGGQAQLRQVSAQGLGALRLELSH